MISERPGDIVGIRSYRDKITQNLRLKVEPEELHPTRLRRGDPPRAIAGYAGGQWLPSSDTALSGLAGSGRRGGFVRSWFASVVCRLRYHRVRRLNRPPFFGCLCPPRLST